MEPNTYPALRRLVCVSLFALTRCSASPTPPPPQPSARVVERVAPTIDLSPVPAPPSLLATIRIASPRGLARRLGERVGIADLVPMLEEALPGAFSNDEAMARSVDLDAPVDMLVYANGRGRARVVVAFGALSLSRAEDALAQGHRLTSLGNGAQRIERTGRGSNECPDAPEGSTEECVVASQAHCVLAPAAGAENAARFVCANRDDDIEPVLAYLTRTLPRTPATASDGELVVDVAPDGLRHEFTDDAQEAVASIERRLASPDAGPTSLLDPVRAYVRDQVGPTLTHGLDDLHHARITAYFSNEGLVFRGEVGFRSTNAPIVQRLVAAARTVRPNVELLGRLLPSATAYGVGALSAQAFRPERELLSAIIPVIPLEDVNLPPAGGNALRSAVNALLQTAEYDHVQFAVASGSGVGGASWSVGVYQADAPVAPQVARFRNLVATLRRPDVARAIHTAVRIHPATMQTPVPVGFPAGSFVLRVPVPASVTSSLRASLGLGTSNVWEVVLVPEGNTLWVAYGADARARLREARAPHPATLSLPGATESGVFYAGALLPTGAADLASRYDPQVGRILERVIQRTTGGNTPLLFFARVRSEGEGAVLSGDFTLPNGVLSLVGASLRQSP